MRYYIPVVPETMANEMLWFVVGLIAGAVLMALIDYMIDRRMKNVRVCTGKCREICDGSTKRDGRGTEKGNENKHHPTLDLYQ